MGVDILYFADHDFPMDSADIFMKEFSNRVNGNVEIYDWNQDSFKEKNGKWYVSYNGEDRSFESYFPNSKTGIEIHFSNDDLDIEVELAKDTIMIWKIKENWDKEINCYRWYTMDEFFSKDKEFAAEWKEKLISQIKEILTPIFHSTKVLLTKDSSSYEHETLAGEYLIDKGETIEQALLHNSEFKEPCAILRNNEAFGHDPDLPQPLYVFDF